MPGSRITVLLLTLLLALPGCGSSPPVRFFTLEPAATGYAPDRVGATVLGLGPLRIADYLKRPQFVTRGEDAELIVDELNRWAEPLGTAIHRTLADNVDGLLDGVAVVAFPDTDTANIDVRVVGRVYRFDVDTAGLAVLEVQWRIENADGADVTPPRRDRYEARAARREDPSAIAAALNDTLAGFSRDIAQAVRGLDTTG
jgi:uncharacterized lipoprotein YmbA